MNVRSKSLYKLNYKMNINKIKIEYLLVTELWDDLHLEETFPKVEYSKKQKINYVAYWTINKLKLKKKEIGLDSLHLWQSIAFLPVFDKWFAKTSKIIQLTGNLAHLCDLTILSWTSDHFPVPQITHITILDLTSYLTRFHDGR